MGLAPAGLLLAFLCAAAQVVALDSTQVGAVAAGIDIRIPLDAFQCDPWLVYYNIAPTDQGRDLGVDYNAQKLLLTTVDDARTPIVTINLPQGEGVISWQMNMKHDSQFFVAPHGVISQGDYVEVKSGGGGDACLTLPTQTINNPYVTYNGPAFDSQQANHYETDTRFFNQRTTSPAAGLQTHIVPEGVLVTSTQAAVPNPTPSSSSSTPTSSKPPSDNSSSSSPSHESSGSQTSSPPTATITTPPTTSSSVVAATDGSKSQSVSEPPDGSSAGDPGTDSTAAGSPSQASGDPTASSSRSSSHTAAIAAGVTVGVVVLLFGILCFVLLRRRRERARGKRPIPYASESAMTEAATVGSFTPIYEPQARVGKSGAPTARYYHDDPITPSDATPSRASSEVPMDLARALAVVAAHVRHAEDVPVDGSGAPPEYSRAAACAPIVGSRRQPATVGHKNRYQSTSTEDSSNWSP